MSRTSYSIGSPTRVCAATGRELASGEAFVGAVSQSPEGDELVRLDYSDAAWESGSRPQRPLIVLGFWRSVVPGAGVRRRTLIDDAALLELFEQTGEDLESEVTPPSPLRLAFRFVLALLLIRKRLLVCESSRGRVMKVRVRGGLADGTPSPTVGVVDPGLDEARVIEVTGQLRAVLLDDVSGGATGGEGS